MPIAPLVATDDTDLAKWQAGDQATFLDMACFEVRRFCGWHIAPAIPVTDKTCWFGERGLVMLGSTHVTEVSQVSINGQILDPDCDYTWQEPKGWLRLHTQSLRAPSWPEPNACVSFVHGYEETPPDVKAVIFEVMATAMELPASNASEVMTMQYRFNLKPDVGVALSPQQKVRLGHYAVRNFGGQVRP